MENTILKIPRRSYKRKDRQGLTGMVSLLQLWLQFHVSQLVVRFEPGVATILRCISRLELIKPSNATWSCRWERGSAHAWVWPAVRCVGVASDVGWN